MLDYPCGSPSTIKTDEIKQVSFVEINYLQKSIEIIEFAVPKIDSSNVVFF